MYEYSMSLQPVCLMAFASKQVTWCNSTSPNSQCLNTLLLTICYIA